MQPDVFNGLQALLPDFDGVLDLKRCVGGNAARSEGCATFWRCESSYLLPTYLPTYLLQATDTIIILCIVPYRGGRTSRLEVRRHGSETLASWVGCGDACCCAPPELGGAGYTCVHTYSGARASASP